MKHELHPKQESQLKQKLEILVKEYFSIYNRDVPNGLLNYLQLYLEPTIEMKLCQNDILNITKQCNLKIDINEFDPTHQKILYVLCKMRTISRERPRFSYFYKIPLKKLAFGLENPSTNQKNTIQETEIVQFIFHNGQTYQKFKNMTDGTSMAHLHYLKTVKDEIRNYEMTVLNTEDNNILHFYIKIKPFFKRFSLLSQINSHFLETRNPFNFLRIYHKNFLRQDNSLLYKIVSNCTTQLNENLNEWLRSGQFTDYGKEFFITKNDQAFWISYSIESEILPFFISQDIAKEILYIGKASNLIRQVKLYYEQFTENLTSEKKDNNTF
ncbi:Gamma-tubulin complex, DGRIP91/SPC98 component, partial [Pseudoloma neurophilia]